jgi:energy-coupling factor transport system ATP-binding protein
LGGLTIALAVVSTFVPLLNAVGVLSIVPMAVIAQRHRTRALVIAAIAAAAVGFVAGGIWTTLNVVAFAVIGGVVGEVKRRGGGLAALVTVACGTGLAISALLIAVIYAFGPVRELLFTTIHDTVAGMQKLLQRMDAPVAVVRRIGRLNDLALHWWWTWIGVSTLVSVVVSAVLSWFVLGRVIDRLARLPVDDLLDTACDPDLPVGPLPVRLDGVSFRYPGGRADALRDIALTVDVGEFVAVVGHNGSGKSTLARVLAGRAPTSGTVRRPGSAGLGRFGGTAVVLQRPESQILGVLVADDVVWGMPEDAEVDVDSLLAEVGLAGMGGRETLSLSGGQQQRLAVASALARRPRLLIADEATAMVDPAGRRELVALLRELPRRHRMAVVLVTHHEADAAAADRVIHLRHGGIVDTLPDWGASRPVPSAPPARADAEPLLRLSEVSHTYLARTPWATDALHGVNLTVRRGEGVLIVGGNGSGKSTLAWIMAGLITPTSGSCELAGEPTTGQVGRVGLAFQHSRLQLLRRTVGAEIMSWGGPRVGSTEVGQALDAVGLDRILAARSIEELSGGQARRVLIAGLMAARPRLVVLDEPLAGLDPEGRRDIVELLASLRRSGLTLVVISHDTEGMTAVCNRTVLIDAGRVHAAEPSPAVPA